LAARTPDIVSCTGGPGRLHNSEIGVVPLSVHGAGQTIENLPNLTGLISHAHK